MTSPPPKTVAQLIELVSQLNSRKAVFHMLITHLRTCYCETDSGPPEMRVVREDSGVVPSLHIEKAIIELETMIDLTNAELEELQNQPFGGSAPPAANTEPKQSAPKSTEKKGPSGKTRPQGSSPS